MAMIEKRKGKEGTISYRARVRVKGRPTQSKTFARLTDAKRWAAKTESDLRDGKHFPGHEAQKHTFSDLVERYIAEVLPHKKPKLAYEQTTQLKWWSRELGAYRLSELTPAIIIEARSKLIKEETPRGGLRSPASANRYLSALSHAYNIAVDEWEWCDESPVRRVKKFREPRGRTRFLSMEELKALLATCRKSKCTYLPLVVTLAVSTGMRQGEILGLTWDTVNLKEGYLVLLETKNGTQRRVPLHGEALELFKQHNKVRRIDSPLVFPGTNPKKPKDIRSAFEYARDQAKLEDFRFHDLRHSAASYLAMSGATTRDIAEVLGHKTLQMVKRYSHLADSHTSEVVAKMNEKVFSSISGK
jgi:integrase